MSAVNDTLLTNSSESLGTNWTSEALYTNSVYLLSIQLVFTGSPVGIFSLQSSNDEYGKVGGPSNWVEIPGSAISISAAGDHTWNFSSISFNFLRVVYTRTSGTGSLISAQYHGKGV